MPCLVLLFCPNDVGLCSQLVSLMSSHSFLPVVLRLVLWRPCCTSCCWLSGCCGLACLFYTFFAPGSSDPLPFLAGVLFTFLWALRDSRYSAVGSWLGLGVSECFTPLAATDTFFGLFGLLCSQCPGSTCVLTWSPLVSPLSCSFLFTRVPLVS